MISFILIMMPIVSGDIVSINAGSGNSTIGYDIVVITPHDYIEGFFFGHNVSEDVAEDDETVENISSAGSGGTSSSREGFYTLNVETLTSPAGPGTIIIARVTIINKRTYTIKGTSLEYYLTDNEGNKYEGKLDEIVELAPGENIFEKELELPSTGVPGEWKFNVMFNRVDELSSLTYDSFEVSSDKYKIEILTSLLFLLPLTALISFMFLYQRRKEPEEKRATPLFIKIIMGVLIIGLLGFTLFVQANPSIDENIQLQYDHEDYSLITESITTSVANGDVVVAKITLINNRKDYIKESKIKYYLTDGKEKKYEPKLDEEGELKPGKNIFEKKLAVPTQSELGTWKFNVVFGGEDVSEGISYDSFVVKKQDIRSSATKVLLFIFTLTGLIGFVFFFKRRVSNEQE